jgi:ferrous iron transport protein B
MDNKKEIAIALIGNPNTGKTSLLNSLTGRSYHVGNWSGKTVDKFEGSVEFEGAIINITDLPGTYSLAPFSDEEKITRNFLRHENIDLILQIVDANTLERNLLITMELLALGKKMILAFNFNCEAAANGRCFDVKRLEELLGIPIVQIEANTGKNKRALLERIIRIVESEYKPPSYLNGLLKNDQEIRHNTVLNFIEKKISSLYPINNRPTRTDIIDKWLLNKYLAWPIFLTIFTAFFKIMFLISQPLISLINFAIGQLGDLICGLDLDPLVSSFFAKGLLGGVGAVITFAPLIFMLFLLIAAMEDSGYLSRTVVMFDKLFRKFGVSGKSFIPMMLGFGCNVPAILATRTIRNKKEKLIAIFVSPFISCSARLPIYLLFAGAFFPRGATAIVMLLYIFGVLTGLIASLILSRIIKTEESNTLIVELPPYRRPSLINVAKHAWEQMVSFIRRVGSIILIFVFISWALASLPLGVEYASEKSILGMIGLSLAPIFKPLGFGTWPFAVAILTGFTAKENTIGILGTILKGAGGYAGLAHVLPSYLTPLEALSFVFFILLYTPCLATVITVKREIKSWRLTFLQIAATLSVAWLVSFMIYQGGILLGYE